MFQPVKSLQYPNQKKISSNHIEKLIKASYKVNGKANKIGSKNGFKLDKSLSNREAKVFVNKTSNMPTVVYTGSRKPSDWVSNAQLAVGLLGNTQRLKRSQDLMNEVKNKYKNKPVTTIGHSLGGSLAESVGGDKVITMNKGVGLAGIGKKINANQTDIRTGTDPVSILSRFQTGGRKVVIPNTNYINPLIAHSFNDVSSLKIKI